MDPILTESAKTQKLQVFTAAAHSYAIACDQVAAITDWRPPVPLPHAPITILGVISIQGRMLTLIDLAKIFGDEFKLDKSAPRYVIALRGEEQLALAVDEIGKTIEIDTEQDQLPEPGLVEARIKFDGMDVDVVRLSSLFATAMRGRERRRRRF